MASSIRCEIEYIPSVHLSHIYAGFETLHEKGVLRLTYNTSSKRKILGQKPLLNVKVNNRHRVIYDLLDGFNWIEGSIDENLAFFNQHFTDTHFYFKRSFHQDLLRYMPDSCKLYPLGLNYVVREKFMPIKGLRREVTARLTNRFVKNEVFEAFPEMAINKKILFRTILYDPNDVKDEYKKADRDRINRDRINMLRLAIESFGNDFSGGLIPNPYSLKYAPDLVIHSHNIRRKKYLQLVKEHAICISTTGLHKSIPWKIGEYVAASRAIVTEPLSYEVPGNFEAGKNYLEYNTPEEFINQVTLLRSNQNIIFDMMIENWRYYNNWLKPECLVFNSLLRVLS